MDFFGLFCFFEMYEAIKPKMRAATAGRNANFDKGVTAKITVRIAAINPKMINNRLILLIF